MCKDTTEELANYIMANCPFQISAAFPEGESAVAVAVRLMDRMADGIGKALSELGIPNEGYPAPVANAVEILQQALGQWGKM